MLWAADPRHAGLKIDLDAAEIQTAPSVLEQTLIKLFDFKRSLYKLIIFVHVGGAVVDRPIFFLLEIIGVCSRTA